MYYNIRSNTELLYEYWDQKIFQHINHNTTDGRTDRRMNGWMEKDALHLMELIWFIAFYHKIIRKDLHRQLRMLLVCMSLACHCRRLCRMSFGE